MRPQSEHIYLAAKERWGRDGQTMVLMEECGELIAAMAQYLNGKRHVASVIEEIADVEIMLEQMHLYFDTNAINQVRRQKLDRLAKTLGLEDRS
jgi:NTP pyrophosphatase (non-canonical NTP hydrolase)